MPFSPLSAEPLVDDDPAVGRSQNCVHALFENQAERSPDRIAVDASGECLSYRELNARSNRLAHYLKSNGVGPGISVCVCLDRSVQMLVGLLGVLKAGGNYVPLDPAFPRDRLKYMLDDSGAPIIVTLQSLHQHLPKHRCLVISLDGDRQAIDSCSGDNPLPSSSDVDLAYLIYTSGSTGKPKGVEVTHGGVVNFLTSINRILRITERDVFMAVTTLSFDICAFDLFSPLCAGAKVLLIDRDTATDGVCLRGRLEHSDATVMQATPATWRMLIEAGWKGPSTGRSLKAISGGDALPRELAEALLFPGVELWNLYGPTETSIYSTCHRVTTEPGTVPIGKPLDNTSLYILNADMQQVPNGEAGELYIGGVGVARGYRNRPELTAERFLPDPFASTRGARMYRTGDIARFRPDGLLEYLGRSDHQVKIRGYRIELEEIESNLLKQPGVRAAVVVAQERENGAQRLVGFVSGDLDLNPSALRDALRDVLPDYMIPAIVLVVRDIPLTFNGKIDRKALPMPAWGENPVSDYVAPVDDRQRELARLFSKVLDAPRVGANDNFFELGGDSLSAVSLAIHIQQKFHRTITLAELYESPTVAKLATVLVDNVQTPGLMTLRIGGHKPPLICLPGSGGSSLCFGELLQHLPMDRPVYGYNIPPSMKYRPDMRTIRDYANHVLGQIRQVCPTGPFHLLGYSFGGNVAFEIAHLLGDHDDSLGLLGMIDSWAPGYPFKLPLVPRMKLHFTNILYGRENTRLQYLAERLHNLRTRVMWRRRRLMRAIRYRRHQQPTAQQTLDDMLEDAEIALQAHRPAPLNRRVDFYRVDVTPTDWRGCSFEDPHNGWRKLVTGDLNMNRLPCTHHEVFEARGISAMAPALIAQMEMIDAGLG